MITRRGALVWLVTLTALFVGERTLLASSATDRARAPTYQVDPQWPKIPKQWTLGQVAGVAVDARDHAWIIQRPWSLGTDEVSGNPEAACCGGSCIRRCS